MATAQAAETAEADAEEAAAAQVEEDALESGDGSAVWSVNRESTTSSTNAAASTSASSANALAASFGIAAKYISYDPPPRSETQRLAAEVKYQDAADRIAREWADIDATAYKAAALARAAGAGDPVVANNTNKFQTQRQNLMLREGKCALENDVAFTFDTGVFKGTMMLAEYGHVSPTSGEEAYIKAPDTLGYCSNFWQLCYHFPTSLKTPYPEDLRKAVWTNAAFLDWATRMTAEMTVAALPNPELTFQEPVSLTKLSQNKYNKENQLERPWPSNVETNLMEHPVWNYQIRTRCMKTYRTHTNGINQCTEEMREAHEVIVVAVRNVNTQERPKDLARQNIDKVLETLELKVKKKASLVTEKTDCEEQLVESATLLVDATKDLEHATAEKEAADQAKQDNAALVKTINEECKVAKKLIQEAKKAKAEKEDLATLTENETDAKNRLASAKADTKVIATCIKTATKRFGDAKQAHKTIGSMEGKLTKKIEMLQSKIKSEQDTIQRTVAKADKPKGTIDKVFGKIDGYRMEIEQNEAILVAKQTEIRQHIQAIITCIVESREAEIQSIVQQHVDVRDALLKELDVQMQRIEGIEKLRADRISAHGQPELNRRYEKIQQIVQLKHAENERRDQVNRDCELCGKAVGNKSKARDHFKKWGGTQEKNKYRGCPKYWDWLAQPTSLPPKITFATKEPVHHICCDPPSLDGSFWNSSIDKKGQKSSHWHGHAAGSVVMLQYEQDVSMSPWGGWWCGFAGDFYDHGKLIKGPSNGGSLKADDYVTTGKCNLKPMPASPSFMYDNAGLSWDQTKRMWTRTFLQWKPPHEGPNGFVGDRFYYLTHRLQGSGHRWFATAVPEALAESLGCGGDDLGLETN